MKANEINDSLARACGLPTERLHSFNIEVRADRWPVVRALYVPEDAGDLIRVLATLVLQEDIHHVEDTPT